jgi:hypothetical protein
LQRFGCTKLTIVCLNCTLWPADQGILKIRLPVEDPGFRAAGKGKASNDEAKAGRKTRIWNENPGGFPSLLGPHRREVHHIHRVIFPANSDWTRASFPEGAGHFQLNCTSCAA